MRKIDDPFYQALIGVLRDAREAAGMRQEDLAGKLGRPQSYVSKYETRAFGLDVTELRAVCTALGLDWFEVNRRAELRAAGADAKLVADTPNTDPLAGLPASDADWQDLDWQQYVQWLVAEGFVTYKEIASLVLGHLNPSQVGTSIASKKTFQGHYEKGKTWQAVRGWHFDQLGRCVDCGTRLELQADHMTPREQEGDVADRLDNMTLRCRRCNVVRRPSHKNGGKTHLTAESALMWLLLTKKPKTYQEYEALCRAYGLTMANVRFQEAWAMAHWLRREGKYEIGPDTKY